MAKPISTATRAPARERLSREEWLDEALEVLSRQGEGKLRIDSICQALRVTKGSFYWHFKNRRDFLESIVKFWDENYNREVFRQIQNRPGSAGEKLRFIFEYVTRKNLGRYDVAFDAWAAHEPEIAGTVADAYRHRFENARAIFGELGFRGIELDTRVTAFICYLKAGSSVSGKAREKNSPRRIAAEFDFFTRPST